MRVWLQLFLGLSEALIPAYIFFALMDHTARNWKIREPHIHGLLVLRFAQIALVLSTFLFLVEFIDNVRDPFSKFSGGGLASVTFWILALTIVFPIFCLSALAHSVLGRHSKKRTEEDN